MILSSESEHFILSTILLPNACQNLSQGSFSVELHASLMNKTWFYSQIIIYHVVSVTTRRVTGSENIRSYELDFHINFEIFLPPFSTIEARDSEPVTEIKSM